MKLRPYAAADESAVVALWKECGLLGWADPRKEIARKLRVNPEWFLVGERDSRIIGTCMVGYEGHRGWINYLAVAAECRGRGHGRELVAEAERLLRAAGCAKINLQVRSTNARVIAFYERLGFKADAVLSFGKRLEAE
jgi:ribosomal protein S18 acetylase RimI-like enzyme